MVLTKQYDRHAPEKVFGIIGSGNATNIALLPSSRRVFVPACEAVLLWDLKTHEQVKSFVDENAATSSKKNVREEAVVLAASTNGKHLAVGYQTGMIRIFAINQNEAAVLFHGHKSTITTLTFTEDSATLISGSKVID
jgi:U3 small nucleolar RNA-associated protein 12